MHPLFALFRRAIREHARSGALVGARTGLAVTLLSCLVFSSSRKVGASGLEYFQAVIWVNALYITLAGCSFFASVITEEKEQGTLGLLRMTDISPLALLLGKGTSRLLDGVLLLSVQIPFTLIGITLGGITWTQVLAAYAGLAAYLFLICNVALLCSVLASRSGMAAAFACFGALLIAYGGGLMGTLFGSGFGAWRALDVFSLLGVVTTTNFSGPIFSEQFTNSIVLGVVAFALAWVLFDRFAMDTEAVQPGGGFMDRITRSQTAGRAPVFGLMRWKDYHFVHGGDSLRIRKGAVYCLVAVIVTGVYFFGRRGQLEALEWGAWMVKLGVLASFAELAIGTSRMMRLEVRDRTLPALATVPLHTIGTLLEEKQVAVRRAVLPALAFTGAGVLICFVAGLGTGAGPTLIVAAPFIIACLTPYIIAEGLLLQRFIIYCSLRYPTGSVPIAVGIWLLVNATILLLTGLIFGPAAPILAVIPVAIWAAKLRQENLKMIERLAAE